VALWWVAQNLWNISVYVKDARAEELPLVGGGEHDWNYLLVFCYVNSVKFVMLPFLEGAWRTGPERLCWRRTSAPNWSGWHARAGHAQGSADARGRSR